jgi:DNA-binding NarL/FixJ family response regulator
MVHDPRSGAAPVAAAALARLTPRERQVLRLVAQGLNNAEIARGLGLRPGTVKAHFAHITAKLGLRDRVAVVVFAWRNGLGDPPGGRGDAR